MTHSRHHKGKDVVKHAERVRPLHTCGYVLGVVLLTGTLFTTDAQALVNVTVNETITPDNCEVTLAGLDGSGALDWGQLPSSTLSGKNATSSVKTFTLALTKCGNSYGTRVPTITVQGTTLGTPATGVYQFRNANSKATGMGYILRFNDTKVTWVGGASPPNLKKNATIAPTGGDVLLPANWKTGTPINVAVALSTGDQTVQSAGDINAAITFTFEYQ
ncbi:fimbrial protein [Serratia marcescens]|uniref:fimbrial protein n=1 Tax=Serratia marcescens TaxID=615 RepID=UPI001EF0D7B9|nr:fimbrial protein [Serratia marcescens]ULH10501.1 fimbrial protein [Serratia marcescens]